MKKPLLYPKLAWQGIRKNAETYLPYLLMGILMVGVSYIMNYLTRPALMGALSMGGTTLMVLQMGKIDSTRPLYSLLNALAALLIGVSLLFAFNMSAFLVEAFWFVISLYGIINCLRRRSARP